MPHLHFLATEGSAEAVDAIAKIGTAPAVEGLRKLMKRGCPSARRAALNLVISLVQNDEHPVLFDTDTIRRIGEILGDET